MSTSGVREKSASRILLADRVHMHATDWDASVRRAFLDGCLQHGVRTEMARLALASACNDATAAMLRDVRDDAARRAALGWLTIEKCLEQYDELAALALERCIEETALQIRRQSCAPSAPPRRGSGVRDTMGALRSQHDRNEAALGIVELARERLARFWASSDTSAA